MSKSDFVKAVLIAVDIVKAVLIANSIFPGSRIHPKHSSSLPKKSSVPQDFIEVRSLGALLEVCSLSAPLLVRSSVDSVLAPAPALVIKYVMHIGL